MTSLDSVEQAVLALKRGEMVIVVDDDDRENEGDLDRRRREDHAGADGVHDPPHQRHRVRADDRRGMRAG